MSSYEYSYTSSSGAAGGSDAAGAAFSQIDANKDGSIDRNEFNSWLSGGGAGASGSSFESVSYSASGAGAGAGAGGAYESVSYSASGDGGLAGFGGAGFGGAGSAGFGGVSSYESTSFSSGGGAVDLAGGAGGAVVSTLDAGAAAGGAAVYDSVLTQAASYTADSNAAWSRYGAEVRGAGLYVDSNPQIIRRQAPGGVQTYTQNIKVRFLQPPPVPPPGPLIIKEVRPPQPPALPPLRIKQQAPPLPQPPPLVLRERPPQPPAVQASQTVVRKLAALPVPPRSVIIERIPAPPPRPRDIVIERWIPYGPQPKRKTVVQRAAAAKAYAAPRNVIIQYEGPQVRVVRQFQRLGVVQENPQAYLARWGAQLLDANLLLQQARAAGVVEDISPPAFSVAVSSSSGSFGVAGAGGAEVVSGGDLAGGASYSSTFESSSVSGGAGGVEVGLAGLAGGEYSSSTFESSGYSSGGAGGFGGAVGFGLADGGLAGGSGFSSSSFESSSFSTGGAGGFDVASAAFNLADSNKDGRLDANEFKQFVQGGL